MSDDNLIACRVCGYYHDANGPHLSAAEAAALRALRPHPFAIAIQELFRREQHVVARNESEPELSKRLANDILDTADRGDVDPDSNLVVLARQFLRAQESLDRIAGPLVATIDQNKDVEIDYTNWKGERRVRKIAPLFWWYGWKDPWHPKAGWLLFARDLDAEGNPPKWFAMANLHAWKELATP